MSPRALKMGLGKALESLGFARRGAVYGRHSSDVWTLAAINKGCGEQWFINVGFWLDGLGGDCPGKVEASHMYFRLERLVPEVRETILLACSLGEPGQPAA